MRFPEYRPRRLRKSEALRSMVREVRLDAKDFILPFFVRSGNGVKKPIMSMPGHFQLSPDALLTELEEPIARGIPAILLFGIPDKKDPVGSEAYAKDGIIQKTIAKVKKAHPDLVVITDVCLCEYTDHGHCGVIQDGDVDNDATLELLARMAVSHARAGADIVAPSDMMDGRVGAIREALDEAGLDHTPIMAYAAKYASAFYGPFRDAAESPPQFGDRRSYQMDPANSDEALREVGLDVEEGADIIMVKPALPYLDVIWRVRNAFDLPLAAYNVSGEFAMIKAAAQNGWVDGELCMMEALTAIRRAGADLIISYHALEAVRVLQGDAPSPRKK
ncbi:MAG: porphobilinogen synthase [Thermodesulfobacteriota bacterium]